jgi:leucyl aminopeptidase
MSVSRVKLSQSLSVRKDDLVLLVYGAAGKRCFAVSQLPKGFPSIAASSEKGKCMTAFSGTIGKSRAIVFTARIDGESVSKEEQIAKAVAKAVKTAREQGCRRVVIPVKKSFGSIAAIAEGALLGGYTFDKYQGKKAKPLEVAVAAESITAEMRKTLAITHVMCDGVNFARDTGNEPPNACHPETLAKMFRNYAKGTGLKTTLWNEARLRKEKCGGILAVGKGSKSRPCMMIGQYSHPKPKMSICLVGKGVTFDTGGYSLKPPNSQVGMKYDMCGAGTAWAAASVIAKLKLPVKLKVITPIVENRISDDAYLPTAVLRMRNKMTVEVISTDAEGRLILADALAVASEGKPDCIIDTATLTGAAVVALGDGIAAMVGTDSKLVKQLRSAGLAQGEMLWELPMHDDYEETLSSFVADFKNCSSSRGAGTIVGGLFLRKFVSDSIPWVHIDMAGPGNREDPIGCCGKGAKGFGVKTLVQFARDRSADS